MNERAKYATVLALAVIISLATSYLTTLTLNQSSHQSSNTPSPQPTSSPTSQPENTKIDASSFKAVFFLPSDASYVEVYSNNLMHNLTIVYNYTSLNGTSHTAEIEYGTFTPVFGPGSIVNPGDIPSMMFRIPDYIILDCSGIKYTTNNGHITNREWNPYPQLNITEVYGYSLGLCTP